MSNLVSKYEISVWEDVWDDTKGHFVENRKMVIGADSIFSQAKVFEPNFTRNANGEKKLTFKMYSEYIDNVTGEKVSNPFVQQLVNETKVKLYYEDKWYDFFVKNIQENSATHLVSYQLGDALVQELSKNGFGVTLDPELKNNLGNIEELATAVLEETDWLVESEKFVEKIEEKLVYVYTPEDGVPNAVHIYDRQNVDSTIQEVMEPITGKQLVLAFYSCCKNKPIRFQFIKLDSYEKNEVSLDINGVINEKDCEYYVDIPQPASGYITAQGDLTVFLPEGWTLLERGEGNLDSNYDTTISNWFRGKRYGFSQKTQYIKELEKYCNWYYRKQGNDIERDDNNEPKIYYGYLNSQYNSPIFAENVITNAEFKNVTGWTGSYVGSTPNIKNSVGAQVEAVYGRFDDSNDFVSSEEDLKTGTFVENSYTPYLKVNFPAHFNNNVPVLINSSFYDNRAKIGKIIPGERWYVNIVATQDKKGNYPTWALFRDFDIQVREVIYDSEKGNQALGDFVWATMDGSGILTFSDQIAEDLSKEDFTSKTLKFVLQRKNPSNTPIELYFSKFEVFKEVLNAEGELIKPGEVDTSGVVVNYYDFVDSNNITSYTLDEMPIISIQEKDIDYSEFIPVFNTGAEKTRTISVKESNYFNILQSIAETFEAWLSFEITRDDFGGIVKKCARFKNYAGDNNYAGFRYGVNLKDIQRTNESKNLVSKLIVKQNSNEFGQNGFCTIARAGSNPTGENYIYDFQYYIKQGMLDEKDYVASLYYAVNPYDNTIIETGPDIDLSDTELNLQNYYNRVKKLNDALLPINNDYINLSNELINLRAKKAVEEGLKEAAEKEIESTIEEFRTLTGLAPTQISTDATTKVTCVDPGNNYNIANVNTHLGSSNVYASGKVTATQVGSKKSLDWKFTVEPSDDQWVEQDFRVHDFNGGSINDEGNGVYRLNIEPGSPKPGQNAGMYLKLVQGATAKNYEVDYRYKLSFTLTTEKNTISNLKTIGWHTSPFRKPEIWLNGIRVAGSNKAGVSFSKEQLANGVVEFDVVIYGSFYKNTNDNNPYLFIQPNKGHDNAKLSVKITNLKIERSAQKVISTDKTLYIQPRFNLYYADPNNPVVRDSKVACTIPAYDLIAKSSYTLSIIDFNNGTLSNLLTKFTEYTRQLDLSTKALDGDDATGIVKAVENKEAELEALAAEREQIIKLKTLLNQKFYETYSRFIQEGTWTSEDYMDDDKYYADALSVMYNSCYPKVSYTINTLALAKLPGYENFTFNLGDMTYAEDPELFGDTGKVEVVITEITENLDDASKNTIKTQNYKTQFQDLFQKINATVQQTQFNSGSYAKAAELASANNAIKGKFVTDALSQMTDKLAYAGQTTVVQDEHGITLTDEATKDQMRLIGGGILMSVEDPNTGIRSWKTGLTPNGISASHITSGSLDTGSIVIKNGNDSTFKWDAYGLSAYDIPWSNDQIFDAPRFDRFVRFDKHGIYGINSDNLQNLTIDGQTWKPSSIDEIDALSTFALTWEGLKVTGSEGVVARIGKSAKDGKIINIIDKEGKSVFAVAEDGELTIAASFSAETGFIAGWEIKPTMLVRQVEGEGYGLLIRAKPNDPKNDAVLALGYTEESKWNSTTAPFRVMLDGRMFATSGKIGGWDIHGDRLLSHSGSHGILLRPNPEKSSDPALAIGYSTTTQNSTKAPFQVLLDGTVKATQAEITGKITATSGAIGGFELKEWYSGGGNIGYVLKTAAEPGTAQSVFLCNLYPGTVTEIGGHQSNAWRLGIGEHFGVDSSGTLYTNKLVTNGDIYMGGKFHTLYDLPQLNNIAVPMKPRYSSTAWSYATSTIMLGYQYDAYGKTPICPTGLLKVTINLTNKVNSNLSVQEVYFVFIPNRSNLVNVVNLTTPYYTIGNNQYQGVVRLTYQYVNEVASNGLSKRHQLQIEYGACPPEDGNFAEKDKAGERWTLTVIPELVCSF